MSAHLADYLFFTLMPMVWASIICFAWGRDYERRNPTKPRKTQA